MIGVDVSVLGLQIEMDFVDTRAASGYWQLGHAQMWSFPARAWLSRLVRGME